MKAFEIHINGDKFRTAGFAAFGSLFVFVNWLRHEGEPPEAERMDMRVTCWTGAEREQRSWGGCDLNVGDEILVRVIETEQVDEPLEIEIRESPVLPDDIDVEGSEEDELAAAAEAAASAAVIRLHGYSQRSSEELREKRERLYHRLRAEFEVETP